MLVKQVVNIFLLVACVSCSPVAQQLSEPGDLIVGGKEIDISEAPWQISLLRFNSHTCGGSIIGKDWVLTAAHCVEGVLPEKLKIRAGSSSNAKGGEIIGVKQVIRHEKFDRAAIDYDYAVLQLNESISFDETKQPIKLHGYGDVFPDGTIAYTSGWGNTQDNSDQSKLRRAEIPIVNQKVCEDAYKSVKSITARMICAGQKKGGRDSCQGDSGGPLTVLINDSPVIVGITSWGYGCAQPNYPGVYGRVLAGREWISDKTGI